MRTSEPTALFELPGRRAFVSGVTSGIGAGVALALARAGCDVAGCGRSPGGSPGARAFLSSVRSFGREAIYLKGDISRPEEPRRFIQSVIEQWGELDILVSNAGRNIFKGVATTTESAWEECMQLDLASHWRISREAYPYLQASARFPGVILVIGSNHGWSTIPGCFPYNVAKAGLRGLVQALAIEWGPLVRTVGIAPGFVDTPGNQEWFDSFPDPQAERIRTIGIHPVGRLGTVEDIGALCVFLAGPQAGFISGTTICVDGGRSALMQDR